MQTKKKVTIFSLLLLAFGFLFNVKAAPNPVVFQGNGVLVDLMFPEEAHPLDNIYHNLTITAQTYLSPLSITVSIYAPINSAWQIIGSPTYINLPSMIFNQSFPTSFSFDLPQNTNGTLRCTLDIQTNQTNYSSLTFYTTQVRTQTYSEILANYESLLASFETLAAKYFTLNQTYNNLTSTYQTLNSTYFSLLANYNSLNSTYTSLLAQNSALQTSYDTLTSTYNTILADRDAINNQKEILQLNYGNLTSNYGKLQGLYGALELNYTTLISNQTDLETALNRLNQTLTDREAELAQKESAQSQLESGLTYDKIVMVIFLAAVVGLIALIVYIKKKEPEPYMVIRKETVAVKPEEEKKE